MHHSRSGLRQCLPVGVGQINTVSTNGLFSQNAMSVQTLNYGFMVSCAAMVAVIRAFAYMDVETGIGMCACKLHGLLGNGKRSVHTTHSGQQSAFIGLAIVLKPLVLQHALTGFFRAVAVGNLIAQASANAQRCRGLGNLVQAAIDFTEGSMMVKYRGHTRTNTFDKRHIGRHAGHGAQQMAVNVPPSPFKYTGEIAWAVARNGQPTRKRRINVMMGVDKSGQDDTAFGVNALGIRMCLAQCRRRANFQNHTVFKQDCPLLYHGLGGIPRQNCTVCQ